MTAGTIGGGSKRLLRELLTPYKRAIRILIAVVVVENAARLAIPYLVKEGIDTGIPPIRADDNLEPLFLIVGADARGHADPGAGATAVPRPVGPGRPGRALRAAAPGVQALPGAEPGLPRGLHLGPGDLPADLRRRRDLRDARDRLRRTGHRRADPGRHRRAAALPRREARSGRADVRAVPGLAHAVVPPRVREVLQGHPREGRAGHRPLRRVDGRDPRGAGVPSRAAQPGDLRRRQRPVPPRQPRRVPAGRVVHARHPADRQRHHRHRAALRRLPRLPRRRHHRRARGVPALPAPVLRADDGDLAVLQHLPVRLGGAGQAGRCPRGGAVGARAHRPGRAERRRRR